MVEGGAENLVLANGEASKRKWCCNSQSRGPEYVNNWRGRNQHVIAPATTKTSDAQPTIFLVADHNVRVDGIE